MNQWFLGAPEKSCLINRGQGRGKTGNLLQGTEGDIPRLQYLTGDEKGTIPGCPLFQGRGRGRHFQWFCPPSKGSYHT